MAPSGQAPATTTPAPGQPRSPDDAAFLERFEPRMRTPIVVSAILPLIVVPEAGNWLGVVVGVSTWAVFLVDYVVHTRRLVHYGRTGFGRFDLVVVVVTAPWFLLPGAQAGSFVVLLRLARLVRLLVATRGARRLFERIGRVVLFAAGITTVASLIAYHAEHAANSEFATIGDALWWGVVTLTTVGYGDIVPKTSTGRWAGVMIMVTGIAVLGVLAGSLASFFRLDAADAAADAAGAGDGGGATPTPSGAAIAGTVDMAPVTVPSDAADLAALTAEIAGLRRQLDVLAARLVGDEDRDDER